MEPILIWGASGHALVVAEIIEAGGKFQVAGFIEDGGFEHGPYLPATPVIGDRSILPQQRARGVKRMIIGFGHCAHRLRVAEIAAANGFSFATAIHPNALISPSATIDDGVVVCAGAIVGVRAHLGPHVIINTGAGVDHECVVEMGAHIGPGARLGGRVTIGSAAWVGIGATIRDNVSVGDGAIVGAGALVLRDVPPRKVVVGVPARVIRDVADKEL